MTTSKPWHGVLTATALPFKPDLSIDFDKYADHIKWQAENGVHGAIPNGSLGEYQVLTPEERTKVLKTALDAAPAGFNVVPGVQLTAQLNLVDGLSKPLRWALNA